MNHLILAIDQGTGGTKTVLFETDGGVVAKAAVPLQSHYPQVGFVEQDPVELYENVIASVRLCIDKAVQQDRNSLKRIVAAGVSNQRETFLLWDKTGAPLCRAVVWQCKRAVPICERLKGTSVEAEIRARTGLIMDPYFSGAKLAWLMENDPVLKEAVHSGQALFGTVDTWLLYRLTNRDSYFTDLTNASRTLLFNIHTLDWDEILLNAFGAAGLVLPKVAPSSFPYGASDFEGLFPKPIPITGMIGDSHAALYGQAGFHPGSIKATYGTGSSLMTPRFSPWARVSLMVWNTFSTSSADSFLENPTRS